MPETKTMTADMTDEEIDHIMWVSKQLCDLCQSGYFTVKGAKIDGRKWLNEVRLIANTQPYKPRKTK